MDPKKTPGPLTPDSTFFHWLAERLVHVYGESPNVDFVLSLRERSERTKGHKRREAELLEAKNRYLMAGRAARQTIGLAHARLSHVLVAMLKAREMKVLLDPIWFTEKVRDVAQTLAAGKPDEEQFIGAGSCQMCHENAAELCRFCKPLIKVEVRQSLPNPAGVMSGRDGDSLWEVRAYYSSREEADAAHEIIARPEMNRRAEG